MKFLHENKKIFIVEITLGIFLICLWGLSLVLGKNYLNLSGDIQRFISKCFIITLSLFLNTSIALCINTLRIDAKKGLPEKKKIPYFGLIVTGTILFVFCILYFCI